LNRANKKNLFAFLILVSAFIFVAVFAYPGFMTADTFHQLSEAFSREFSSDQAPTMSWFWSHLLWLAPQNAPQFPILISHLLGIFLGIFLFLDAFYPKLKIQNAILTAAFTIFPPVLGLIGNIWKDIGMISSWLLALGIFSQVMKKKPSWNSLFLIPAFLCLFYGITVRHNAPPAAWPILFWILSFYTNRWSFLRKLTMSFALLLILFVSGIFLTKSITQGHDKSFVHKYTLFDLAGISVYSGDIVVPQYDNEAPWSVEELKKIYTPKSNVALSGYPGQRALSSPRNSVESRDTLKLWVKAVLKHPLAYLYHRYKVTASLLGLTITQEYPYYIGIQEANPPNTWGLKLSNSTFRNIITKNIDRISQGFLFRGYLYLLIIFLILLIKRNRIHEKSQLIYFILGISGILNILTLSVMTGAADFRYNLWTMTTALIMLMLLINENTQKAAKT
jgi:hypothetical protein